MPTCSRKCSAFSRATSLFRFNTFTWPTMQFSSTVMLLNRLKDWNTMPTLARYAAALVPRQGLMPDRGT